LLSASLHTEDALAPPQGFALDRRPQDMKKPASGFAGGLINLLDLSGLLVQAITVRRHGMPMMMVAGMAMNLHLLKH